MIENPWLLLVEIVIAGAILWYLFFRRRTPESPSDSSVQRIEAKVSSAILNPSELHMEANRSAQLVIHRFDRDPDEELFEIEDLEVYALLPALHTTIIPVSPHKRGEFPIVLGGERKAGTLIVK